MVEEFDRLFCQCLPAHIVDYRTDRSMLRRLLRQRREKVRENRRRHLITQTDRHDVVSDMPTGAPFFQRMEQIMTFLPRFFGYYWSFVSCRLLSLCFGILQLSTLDFH